MSDAELMRRFQRDDVKAFEHILQRYEHRIYGFFVKYFSDKEVAKDLTQDCFIRVIDHKLKYDTERPFQPWLFRIASNLANSYFRVSKQNAEESLGDIDISNEDLADNIDKLAFDQLIKNGVHQLSKEHKTVFVLRHYNELSITEIADTLDIKEGTVKSRLYYAHKAMKTYCLQQEIERL